MKITIRDVAREAGVSVATASMVLNNKKGASQATSRRVSEAARRLNYIPSASARSLVRQDSDYIGLLVPEIRNPFYSAIVDDLTRIVEEEGFTLLLGITNNSTRQEAAYVQMFISHGVRGVIAVPVLSRNQDSAHMEMLRRNGIPLVFCTEIYDGCGEPVVMCDFEQGEYDATKYLLDKGLRDFFYVTTDMDTHFVRDRYRGYVRALDQYGLTSDKARELKIHMPRYEETYAQVGRIVAAQPQAVVCINDFMSIAIMKGLLEAGLRIPEDVSLIGFDDIFVSNLVFPRLTTVRQPVREICTRTMEILKAQIDAPADAQRGLVLKVTPQLVIRETTI